MTDQFTDYARQVSDMLQNQDLTWDEKMTAIRSVTCQADILTGVEPTAEEMAQCVQDVRATREQLGR